jgi:hypothetical protein
MQLDDLYADALQAEFQALTKDVHAPDWSGTVHQQLRRNQRTRALVGAAAIVAIAGTVSSVAALDSDTPIGHGHVRLAGFTSAALTSELDKADLPCLDRRRRHGPGRR